MTPSDIGSPEVETDVEFWTRHLHEQAKLLFNLTEDNDLARQAKSFDVEFQAARQEIQGQPRPLQVRRLAFPVLKLRALYETVQGAHAVGTWTGWALPQLVVRFRETTDYAWKKILGAEVSAEEEACFALRTLADYAAFLARWTDPSEADLFMRLLRFQDTFSSLGCFCNPRPLSAHPTPCQANVSGKMIVQAADSFGSLVANMQRSGVKTVVSPMLAAHILRGSRRLLATLKKVFPV